MARKKTYLSRRITMFSALVTLNHFAVIFIRPFHLVNSSRSAQTQALVSGGLSLLTAVYNLLLSFGLTFLLFTVLKYKNFPTKQLPKVKLQEKAVLRNDIAVVVIFLLIHILGRFFWYRF